MSLIYVAPVGNVERDLLEAVKAALPRIFDMPVGRLTPLPEPEYALDLRRRQYSSVAVMHELVKIRLEPGARILGITEKDLFIPMLSFIYGQAQLGGTTALVSLARLRQEFYQLAPNPGLLVTRSVKECVHELGHTFGLVHCLDRSCPMSLATNIRQLDIKGAAWCPDCAARVHDAMRDHGRAPKTE